MSASQNAAGINGRSVAKSGIWLKNLFIDTALPEPELLIEAVGSDSETFHVFSHGKPGQLYINGKWLQKEEIAEIIVQMLAYSARRFTDLNIYACEFAKGEPGNEAVTYLETKTGLKVSASTNISGLNGDWYLERGNKMLENITYNYSLQLDTVHYLPPVVAANYVAADFSEEEVVIATNSTVAISVTVTDGAGTPISGSPFSVVKGTPVVLSFIVPPNAPMSQPRSTLGSIYTDQGMIFRSNSLFSVSYRSRGGAQAGSLSAKGRKGFGKNFRWAVPRGFQGRIEVHSYLSIMAVEFSDVSISGIDPATEITGVSHTGTLNVTLNAGESIIYEVKGANITANIEGHVGAQIASTGNIVINTGGQNAQFINDDGSAASRDHNIDQIISISALGSEYLIAQGNGGDFEKVFVTATANNTQIFLNGSTTANITLNDGDQAIITGTDWAGSAPTKTLYIESTQPVYVQHTLLGGVGRTQTSGMNFIVPISCFASFEADEIGKVGQIGNTLYSFSKLFVIETVGANTTTRQNGSVVQPTDTITVTGTSDYRVLIYDESVLVAGSNWSVISDAAVYVSVFGSDNVNAGYASYVSSFPDIPSVSLTSSPNFCGTNEFRVSDGPWTDYRWYKDGVLIPGENSQTYTATELGEFTAEVFVGSNPTCTQFSSGVSNPCPLPVELIDMQAKCTDENRVILSWQTASEVNAMHFEVMRSENLSDWHKIGRVSANGTTSQLSTYTFKDETTKPNDLLYYRLKQVDYDGQFEWLPIRFASCLDAWGSVSVSPNPAENKTYVDYMSEEDGATLIRLMDATGREVFNRKFVLEKGMNRLTIDLSGQNNGIYFLLVGKYSKPIKLIISK